ncbi:MAG: TM0106 family RecB-like putative nuclease, partial [Candidatus Dormibacteraeota bacterium]|nr:TM0106 family RecB-like putative nuclease [Candidatus Dormibacteraeota bacterium]
MQILDGRLVLSATDLSDFLACEHLASLKHRRALGESVVSDTSAVAEMLSQLGSVHEDSCLQRFRDSGCSIKEFPGSFAGDDPAAIEALAAQTVTAMHAGYDVIYQPVFFDGDWYGRADFLVKRSQPSALGDFSYEVADAKLARRAKAEALLQLCEYSLHVGRIQGRLPEHMQVLLGSGEDPFFLVSDYAAYHDTMRRRLRAGADAGFAGTYPNRVGHCGICQFARRCDQQRHADDHVSLVARIRSDQVRRLQMAGVTTVAALGTVGAEFEVPRLQPATLAALREQARLQSEGHHPNGTPRHELLGELEPGFGLCALPLPSPGDVFFDIEGDPWYGDESLEYLFGAAYRDADGVERYRCWEGHSPGDARRAFESFVDWVRDRRAAHPGMHVYHYAPYERSALLRLMSRYGTRENEVDDLLRGGVLVDLYRVVRQGIRLSTERYGLKQVELLYQPARSADVADAMESVVVYERWRLSGDDVASRDPALLQQIVDYNEADCRSTARLREWLEDQRAVMEDELGTVLARPPEAGELSDSQREAGERTLAEERLRGDLVEGVPDEPGHGSADGAARWLLAQLVGYHHREEKSALWSFYRRRELTEEELADDRDVLGPVTFVGEEMDDGGKPLERYRFAPQEHRIGEGDRVDDPCAAGPDGRRGGTTGRVVGLDSTAGVVVLQRSEGQRALGTPRFLAPGFPVRADVQPAAVAELAGEVIAAGFDVPPEWHAARSLLFADAPSVDGSSLRRAGESPLQAAVRLLEQNDAICLPVQGPPGSGKTHLGARIALARAAHGAVGVTALSHRAISGFLDEVCRARSEASLPVVVGQRVGRDETTRCTAEDLRVFSNTEQVAEALADCDVDVVGGTTWLFAHTRMRRMFDTLIVDEAGQMSLADVLAASRCARHLVLLGDPRQLRQVVHGIHPDGAAASALEHYLGDDITMPANRGLFLETTRRMTESLCTFVSTAFYEGRLHPDASCAEQHIVSPDGPLQGIRGCVVPHDGNRTASIE